MPQCSIAEKIKSSFSISKKYSNFDEDLMMYQFAFDIDQDYEELAKIYSILCSNSQIENRGDLIALTKTVVELKELANKIADINSAITFPNLRSVCCDTDELLEKIQFAIKYGYPYMDDNNVILSDMFDFRYNESNYMKNYDLDETLYTPEEKKADKKFRVVPDKDDFYRFYGNIQKRAFECYGRPLKINEAFNNYIIFGFEENIDIIQDEEFIKNAIYHLETPENPFLNVNQLFDSFSINVSDESDRGVRR